MFITKTHYLNYYDIFKLLHLVAAYSFLYYNTNFLAKLYKHYMTKSILDIIQSYMRLFNLKHISNFWNISETSKGKIDANQYAQFLARFNTAVTNSINAAV